MSKIGRPKELDNMVIKQIVFDKLSLEAAMEISEQTKKSMSAVIRLAVMSYAKKSLNKVKSDDK